MKAARLSFVSALAGAAMLVAAPSASGDSVVLRNGDLISGTVIHKGGDTLKINTDYAGDIEVSWGSVATITLDHPLPIVLEGEERPVQATLSAAEVGRALLHKEGSAGEQDIDLARVTRIAPLPEETAHGVSHTATINVSGAATRGNSTSEQFTGAGSFAARARDHRYYVEGTINRATDSGTVSAYNWLLSGHYDHYFDPHHFTYGRGSLERDRFKDIDLRSTLGGGVGVQLLDSDTTELSVRGGMDYVAARYIANPNEYYPALGWGLNFSHWFWSHRVQAFHSQEGFWNLNDTSKVTLRTRSGVRVPVTKQTTANVQLNVDWERRPPPGRKSTDETLLFGAGYHW